jgi:hypothetical protein
MAWNPMNLSSTGHSKPIVHLQEDHQELLKRFLLFFHLKQQGCFKEVHLSIEDIKDEHANTKLFSKVDMEAIMERLQKEVETTVKSELELYYRMSGRLIISYLKIPCRNLHSVDDG